MNRRKTVLGLISAVASGISVGALTRSRKANAAALQGVNSVSSVYFKTSKTPKFRKIVARFDISGTGKSVTVNSATCSREDFSVSLTNKVEDTATNMTYFSVVFVPKTTPAGDSPVKSGGLADISFSITIDGATTAPTSKGPVIDIDPCATR